MEHLAPSIAYFGAKYILALACVWLTIHFWLNGKTNRMQNDLNLGLTAFFYRRPAVLLALAVSIAGILVMMLTHMIPEYNDQFARITQLGAFLDSLPVMAMLGVGVVLSGVLYRRHQYNIAGVFSFLVVMTAGLVLPVHIMAA